MSGHSKWSQIKRQKGVTDARRGQLFTKIAREVTAAARHGGANPDQNATLRLAVGKARQANMPKDNIARAIERATSTAAGDRVEEVRYEAFGPGGVAMIIDTFTDNRNRTVGDVRSALTHAGGNMGETRSVGWQFEQKGVITIDVDGDLDAEAIALSAIDAGAEDVDVAEGLIEVISDPAALETVRDAVVQAGTEIAGAEVVMRPINTVELPEGKARTLLKLIESLEDLDDVQRVFTNADFPDSILVEA